jgi:DNA-binding transcriptional ArsR family regulator
MLELVAERFRLLSEPMRLRILEWLRRHPDSAVGEIAEALETSQQNLSKHLASLHSAGVTSRRKDGNHVRYAVADPGVLELCDLVCGAITERHAELGRRISTGEPAGSRPAHQGSQTR